MANPKTLPEVFTQIEANAKRMEFIKTGFPKLDFFLDGGFLRKELIVIGAQTGIGKSIFGAHFFHEAAKQGFSCAYFSLEISNELIVSRLVAKEAGVNPTGVMTGTTPKEQEDDLIAARAKLNVHASFMTFYDDTYVLADIVREIRTHTYDFVVIDFIQNVLTSGEKEYDRLSTISLELQKLAKEMDCCIVILSQLSNFVGRQGVEEKYLEYKGSGNIATVCDLGFFVERDKEIPNMNFLTIRKNRRGINGNKVVVYYNPQGGNLHE